jgi:N-acetylglucosamine kinase-like BadF-type ATPase
MALALLWSAPVVTEKVEVGDRGAIDLAPFACTDTPRSTIVQRVCYDEARRYMLVNVGGAYRGYCELPAATFSAFVAAPSMGQFYKQNIERSERAAGFNCETQNPPAS